MSCSPYRTIRTLTAGVLALVIAMGISRFGYTPLLPVMQSGAYLSDDYAGYLASMNYAGYLLGALWVTLKDQGPNTLGKLRLHLMLNIFSTFVMALTLSFPAWLLFRFVAGFSSAMIFVLASGIVLQHLATHRRQGWSGWLYSSIGIGIIFTALAVPPLGQLFGWRGGWTGMGVLCFLLAYPAYHWLEPSHPAPAPAKSASGGDDSARKFLPWMTVAYFCEGLGYIVTGTFLVAMLQRMPGLEHSSTMAWLVVGLAAAPSSIIWMKFGLRLGPVWCLIIAHLTQAAGIVLPVLLPSTFGTLVGAIFYGGTFMGIVTLNMHLCRTLMPHQPHRAIGLLTAAFGAGQIVGPTAAGLIATYANSFNPALYGAAATVTFGALLLWTGNKLARPAQA